MSARGKTSMAFVMGCMDFCWLFAWARFTTASLIPDPFPFPESIVAFTLGGVLARFLKGRGWPVISILAFHLVLMLAASVLMLRAALAPSWAPWDVSAWLRALNDLAPPFGRVRIAVVCVWSFCIWIGGVRSFSRESAPDNVTARFDLGVLAFFALLLVQTFISLQLGGDKDDGATRSLMLSFLAFGILGLGLSRSRTLTQKHYRMGFRTAGVLLTFSVASLLFGAGLVILFFPYLTEAARMGFGEVKAAAGHAEPYLIAILRFMFGPRGGGPAMESGAAAGGMGSGVFAPFQQSGWVERMVTVLGWGLLGILGLAALVAAAIVTWYLVGWLFSRTAEATDDEREEERAPWWSILRRFLGVFRFGPTGGRWGPIQLFSFLVAWGNRSGLPRRPHETPCEYGLRLNTRFPLLKRDFDRIVELFNRRVYGEVDPRPVQLRAGHAARLRLSSPLNWASRLRSRLSGAR